AMRAPIQLAPLALFVFFASCASDSTPTTTSTGTASLRVVNGFTSPVDVVVDGRTVSPGVSAGAVVVAGVDPGAHSLVLRPSQGAASAALAITTTAGATNTVAAVLSNGAVGTAVLDDTNSIVPAGATKVRVLHLAPKAGTIQVYRTQPDFPTPIQWQFPFT